MVIFKMRHQNDTTDNGEDRFNFRGGGVCFSLNRSVGSQFFPFWLVDSDINKQEKSWRRFIYKNWFFLFSKLKGDTFYWIILYDEYGQRKYSFVDPY